MFLTTWQKLRRICPSGTRKHQSSKNWGWGKNLGSESSPKTIFVRNFPIPPFSTFPHLLLFLPSSLLIFFIQIFIGLSQNSMTHKTQLFCLDWSIFRLLFFFYKWKMFLLSHKIFSLIKETKACFQIYSSYKVWSPSKVRWQERAF